MNNLQTIQIIRKYLSKPYFPDIHEIILNRKFEDKSGLAALAITIYLNVHISF